MQGVSKQNNQKQLDDKADKSSIANESNGSQYSMPEEEEDESYGNNNDQKDYIYPLLYIYRAYGHIILEDYQKGLQDFQMSQKIKKLSSSQNFNMVLCQGLKQLDGSNFESAI